jgi:enoyl-CoA hydratase
MSVVLTEVEGRILTVTINRPDKLNALNPEVVDALSAAFDGALRDDAIGGVILTGTGEKAFVAGADISTFRALTPVSARAFAQRGQALMDAIETLGKPVVAALNGFALGGGCELALACDFVHASDRAKFGQPEVKLGIIPGFGGTQRLARRVGIAKAKELCMTGDTIDAAEALRIGLADAVWPHGELLAKAKELAARIAANGPLAVAEVKRLVHLGQSTTLEHAIALEQRSFGLLFGTADQREGMSAFLAKPRRAPQFKGQ